MAVAIRSIGTPMTREEFDRIPEGPPYYDYVNGEAVEVNKPKGRHQVVSMRLGNMLWEFAQAHGMGQVFPEIDVELPTGDSVGPDILFLSAEHAGLYDETSGDLRGAPDLVVEVLSPSTVAYDRIVKMDLYLRSRVSWVWLVDPDSLAVEEFKWTPEGYLRVGATAAGQAFSPQLFSGLNIDLLNLIGHVGDANVAGQPEA